MTPRTACQLHRLSTWTQRCLQALTCTSKPWKNQTALLQEVQMIHKQGSLCAVKLKLQLQCRQKLIVTTKVTLIHLLTKTPKSTTFKSKLRWKPCILYLEKMRQIRKLCISIYLERLKQQVGKRIHSQSGASCTRLPPSLWLRKSCTWLKLTPMTK